MDDEIYREEYTREMARLAAQKATGQQAAKPRPKWLSWAALLSLLGYSLFILGETLGLEGRALLAWDFLLPALGLALLFIWLLHTGQ